MRQLRVGDRVISIAVTDLGVGVIYDTHWEGADVIWPDGRRSSERYQDLVYAGYDVNWKNTANERVGNKVFEATITRDIPISFANQIDTNDFWSNSFDNAVHIVSITTDLPITNADKVNAARERAREEFVSRRLLLEGSY